MLEQFATSIYNLLTKKLLSNTFENYKGTFMDATQHDLVLNNISLAQKLARAKKRKVYHVSLEELEAAAFLGLVEAAHGFDDDDADRFPVFAFFRVAGAINDYLRELAWGPRREPLQQEVFDLSSLASKEEVEHATEVFESIVAVLPDVNQVVLRKYYIECEKLHQIADGIGVHESRVSQILSDSRGRLRRFWENKQYELWKLAA
jgi:RNA polymerase sigma factor (sigma-70 family)